MGRFSVVDGRWGLEAVVRVSSAEAMRSRRSWELQIAKGKVEDEECECESKDVRVQKISRVIVILARFGGAGADACIHLHQRFSFSIHTTSDTDIATNPCRSPRSNRGQSTSA